MSNKQMELIINLKRGTTTVKLDGKEKKIKTAFLKKLYVNDLIHYMKE
jgi:hypothetical protein